MSEKTCIRSIRSLRHPGMRIVLFLSTTIWPSSNDTRPVGWSGWPSQCLYGRYPSKNRLRISINQVDRSFPKLRLLSKLTSHQPSGVSTNVGSIQVDVQRPGLWDYRRTSLEGIYSEYELHRTTNDWDSFQTYLERENITIDIPTGDKGNYQYDFFHSIRQLLRLRSNDDMGLT